MSTITHLRALLRKNWLLWKRNMVGSILELFGPIAFIFLFLVFRYAEPIVNVPETSYYQIASRFTSPEVHTTWIKACNNAQIGGKIALAPPDDPIILQYEQAVTSLGFSTLMFADNDAINDYIKSSGYGSGDKRICYGVVMQKNDVDNTYEYLIRYNVTLLTGTKTQDIPNTNPPEFEQIEPQDLDSFNKYVRSGFLTVQTWVDNLIFRQEIDPSFVLQADIASVTVPAYKRDYIILNLKGMTQYIVGMPILLPFLRMVTGILREKEKRIREGMKIMGLQNSAFYLSWFITYFIIMSVISAAIAVILRYIYFFHSHIGWLFLWHWEYSIWLISLGILVSVFFNKAKIGGIAAFLIVAVMGWFYFIVSGDDATANSRFWASMVPPTSLGLSGDYLLSLEAGQKGLTSETVNMEYLNYNMIDHYIWMAIDIVVFLVLAAYLDQVLPSDFGIKKHPLFCLLRKKKRIASTPKNLEEEQSYLQGNINFEETDPTLKNQDKNNESIVIDNLRKVYKNGKLAVDGVSYNMYRGQIFVLLGHNGAGKTSTISMITGLYPPTEGTANVFGMDIREKLEDIRKIMGVCPQHDVLYDELTVKEHLELFAIFKGMNPKDIPQEVNKLIADLDLNEKRDYLSKNLSGGQKRRLSIAIAFIGGSKFILLDEPSSGMDTASRRRLWDMLKNYKHGRVVLLTTHFMDEADYLGDRIGIMGEGKMQCLGRPLFLKNRFGVGYTLTISKKDIKDESEPIIKFIQEYIPESKVVTNISSEITMQLPLETVGKFEQLFDNLDKNLEKLRIDTYGVSVTTLEQVFLNVARLLMKEDKNRIQAVGSESQLGKTPSVEGGEDLDNFDLQKQKITGFWNLFITQFGALIMKRLRYFRRDKNGLVLELFLPVIMVIIGIILIKAQTIATGDILEMTDDFFGDAFQVRYNSLLSDNSAVDSNLINEFNPTTFQMVQVPGNSLAQFNTEIYANRNIDPFSKFNAFFDTVSTSISKYTTLIDTRAKDACPFALNKINNALLKYLKNNSNKQIKLIIAPFEQTPQGAQTFKNVIDGLSIAFVFATAMSFIPTSLITFIVKEKELTVKHQQLVSGISIQSYWCANYLVDLLKYMFPSVLNCLMALAFNAEAIIQGELYGCLWALFMAYGFSVTAFSYLTSFLFKDFGLSQTVTFFFNFGTGFLGGLAIGLLRVFPRTNAIALVLHWFFRPLPTFALTYGLMNLTNRAAYANVEGDTTLRTPWSLDLTGGDVLYLVSTAVLYFVLIFVVEFVKTNKFFVNTLVRNATEPGNRRIDQDVIAEEKRVESTTASNFSIKVDKLRKVYRLGRNKNKVAVNQVSFGIGNGDCFALLGVNGAGKTTTFKMLSGDVLPTAGRAFINGHEIPAQMSQARHHIGYCPQHDPLLDLLTAREHLYLYAAIKGVPYDKRKRMVEKLLKDLNLTQYADIPSGSYSGGNKRKLSVAIAMVGNPPIVFLDEPSTGMDPEARRFMWNVISRISRERKKSSVILTTHSMEEAEALCTKMGIMVNGALRCLGTAQHIKSIYGGGYEIEIKLNAIPKTDVYENIKALGYEINTLLTKEQVETILANSKASELIKEIAEEGSGSAVFMELKRGNVAVDFVVDWMLMEKNGWRLREFLKIHFDKVVLIEHFQSFYRFNIASNISIAKVFGKIEENKELFKIMQYSVKQSTIEQIFNVFANEKSENQQQPELLGSPSDDKNEGVALEVEPKSGSSSSRAGHGIRKTLSISRKSHDNKVYRTLSIDNHDDNIIK